VFRQAVTANSSRDIDRIDEACVVVVEPANWASERCWRHDCRPRRIPAGHGRMTHTGLWLTVAN